MDGRHPVRRTARSTQRVRVLSRACALSIAALASVTLAEVAVGADATILGKAMIITATDAAEDARTVTVRAREAASNVASIANPMATGATLTIIVDGTQPSAQSFVLPAAGWTAIPGGYRYRVAKSVAGPPVRRVIVTKQPGGAAAMRVVLRGDTGTDPLLVVPPASGTEGGVALRVGTERYCVRFGGAAGGEVRADTATRWRIVRPTAEAGCLDPPESVCGNGIVEGDETCDGNASACEGALHGDSCGEPGSLRECSCCYPTGTEYGDSSGADLCCDGNAFPVTPFTRYCGDCLPDGFHCLFGESTCCSGTCFEPAGLGIPVCGSCIESGEPCGGLAEFCCSGTCGTNGLCD